jgi:lysyl-tRNA synthetase class 2
MEEINELIEQRIRKLEDLRQAGFEPFGGAFYAEDHAAVLRDRFGSAAKETLATDPVSCSLAGRVVAMRDFGKAAFAHVQGKSRSI